MERTIKAMKGDTLTAAPRCQLGSFVRRHHSALHAPAGYTPTLLNKRGGSVLSVFGATAPPHHDVQQRRFRHWHLAPNAPTGLLKVPHEYRYRLRHIGLCVLGFVPAVFHAGGRSAVFGSGAAPHGVGDGVYLGDPDGVEALGLDWGPAPPTPGVERLCAVSPVAVHQLVGVRVGGEKRPCAGRQLGLLHAALD